MRKILSLLLCCLLSGSILAQQNFNDSISQSRNRLTKNAMMVLGSWAVANIASGFIIAGGTKDEAKYTWLMNSYWNIFNLGLAGLGYAGTRRNAHLLFNTSGNNEAQQAIEKLYLINGGLDLVYITGGIYLREKGNSESAVNKKNLLKGYGNSVIMQGCFLLLMDATMFTLHHKNTVRVNNKLQQLELRAGPAGLGLSYNF
jgi:hypothetical protein